MWQTTNGKSGINLSLEVSPDPYIPIMGRVSSSRCLTQVFELIGKAARGKTCEAMVGLTSEMEEDLEDFGDTAASDDVLIGCAQAIEHYEIARYGLLKSWATKLGYDEAVTLLDKTLQEEKRTNDLLTQIAEDMPTSK